MYYNVEFHDTILPKTLQLQLRFNAKQQLKNQQAARFMARFDTSAKNLIHEGFKVFDV